MAATVLDRFVAEVRGTTSAASRSSPSPRRSRREFGTTGGYCSAVGWLLPVYRVPLAAPVRPRDLITVLGPLLPDRYSPISPATGHGRQGACLAEIPRAAFDAVTRAVTRAGAAAGSAAWDADALRHGGGNRLTWRAVVEEMEDAAERRVAADATPC